MTRRAKPLVQFNASYYAYPNSVRSAKYLIDTDLSTYDQEHRMHWLERVAELSFSDLHGLINAIFVDAADHEKLRSLLAQHGLFAERFFHQQIRERVARRYAEANIDPAEFQRLISKAWNCDFRIYNRSEALYRIMDHIFDQTVVSAIRDPLVRQKLQAWFDEFSHHLNCTLCGNTFRSIDLSDWAYFGANGYRQCCLQCQIMQAPKKSELTDLIPEFVEKCGFIPNSNANPISHAFTSRLSEEQWTTVFNAYAKMGGIEHAKRKFGSWFKALAATGALPDGVLVTARGIRCLAQDGHTCHSLDEQRIDDWLTAHQLEHEREPIYPFHPELNPQAKRRADWKVQDVFIEYFGLIGDKDYEKKMDEKISLAQQSKINLVALYPSDLTHLDQRLRCLLT